MHVKPFRATVDPNTPPPSPITHREYFKEYKDKKKEEIITFR